MPDCSLTDWIKRGMGFWRKNQIGRNDEPEQVIWLEFSFHAEFSVILILYSMCNW